MRCKRFLTFSCLLILATGSRAQDRKPATTLVKPATTSGTAVDYSDIIFEIDIWEDKSLKVKVVNGGESESLSPEQVNRLLSRFAGAQGSEKERTGPKIVIRPDETLDLGTVAVIMKAARVSAGTTINVVNLYFSGDLVVAPDPKFLVNQKPNPLILVVGMDGSKHIFLNNEKCGSLADLSVLTNRLKQVFSTRAEKREFREGSHEVDRKVSIKLPMSTKFADIGKIATAIFESEAEPILLQIDSPIQ